MGVSRKHSQIKMPTFTYDGVNCVSAGCIFFRVDKSGGVKYLLQQKHDLKTDRKFLEDWGGKSEATDQSIEETAAREAAEETNGGVQDPTVDTSKMSYLETLQASKQYIQSLIRHRTIAIPQRKTKYMLFLVFLPGRHPIDVGDRERHPKFDIPRTSVWLDGFALKNSNIKTIHHRIRHLLYRI